MNRSIPFAAALVVAAVCLPAQDFDRETAVAEMRELVLTKRPSSEWPERDAAIAAWRERVETQGLDLGEWQFLLGVAKYFARDYEGAGRTISAALDRGDLPTDDFDTVVGRILLGDGVRLLREGEVEAARTPIHRALDLYEPAATVYRAVSMQLLAAGNEMALSALDEIQKRMFADERLSAAQRQEVLKAVYAPRRGASGARAAEPAALQPFEAVDLDGRKVSLEALRGKVVLVDFWATWCGPCLREMPNVVAAYEKYHGDGFEVIGISLDAEPGQEREGPILEPAEGSATVAKIRKTMEELGMGWPVVYEGGGWNTRLAQANGIRSIPATFLIDRDGKVVASNLRGEELIARVGALVRARGSR